MKIHDVVANNRRRCFEVDCGDRSYSFPYARLRVPPHPGNGVQGAVVEDELGQEAFSYTLDDGRGDTVHIDAVLDYNREPTYMRGIVLHRLTVEALNAIEQTGMPKRELIRGLGTSPAQLYRLLDPTNNTKSIASMMALLHLLGRRVEVTVTAEG